jgi:hypothetical protein
VDHVGPRGRVHAEKPQNSYASATPELGRQGRRTQLEGIVGLAELRPLTAARVRGTGAARSALAVAARESDQGCHHKTCIKPLHGHAFKRAAA